MIQSQTITTEPPQSSVGEDNARVAAAIVTLPEYCTVMFCETFANALAAALRRASIPIVETTPVFHKFFTAAVFTVPRSMRSAALEIVKQGVTELALIHDATIAVDRAGDGWFAVHGLTQGGATFEQQFLRPEYLAASIDERRRIRQTKTAIAEASLHKAREQGDNPETP